MRRASSELYQQQNHMLDQSESPNKPIQLYFDVY